MQCSHMWSSQPAAAVAPAGLLWRAAHGRCGCAAPQHHQQQHEERKVLQQQGMQGVPSPQLWAAAVQHWAAPALPSLSCPAQRACTFPPCSTCSKRCVEVP
jgi:hypothetical protein